MLTTEITHFGKTFKVVAKMYKGEPFASTYANRTQAQKSLEKVTAEGHTGFDIYRFSGRPFFVAAPVIK